MCSKEQWDVEHVTFGWSELWAVSSLSPDTVSRVRRERNKSGKDRLLRKWLQLWFDFDSTAIRLLIKGHWGHSDVNTSRWPASRSHADLFIMPRPIRAEALSDAFVWRLTSVWRLSRTSGITQEQKTKISTQVAHVTCVSDTTLKVKRSKVKVTKPVYSPPCLRTGSCSGQRGKLVLRCRLQARRSARRREALRRPHGEERGGGISRRVHTHSLFI